MLSLLGLRKLLRSHWVWITLCMLSLSLSAQNMLRLTVSNMLVMHVGDCAMVVHVVRCLLCSSVKFLTTRVQRSFPWCGRSAVMMLSMPCNRCCASSSSRCM